MRTLKFSDVVYGVAQLAGLDRDNLPTHFFKQVRDLTNPRLALAWETEHWPDTIRIDELTVTTSSDVSTIAYPSTAGEILEVYSKNPRKTTLHSSVGFLLYDDGTYHSAVQRTNIILGTCCSRCPSYCPIFGSLICCSTNLICCPRT